MCVVRAPLQAAKSEALAGRSRCRFALLDVLDLRERKCERALTD